MHGIELLQELTILQITWHTLELTVKDGQVQGSVDGRALFTVADNQPNLAKGMCALHSGYHYAFFDNVSVH